MLTLKIESTSKLQGAARLQAGIRTRLAEVVRDTAEVMQTNAQLLAPVRTGALRDSITLQLTDELSAVVFTTIPYAVFVEYGTSRMAMQPFFGPAREQAFTYAARALKSAVVTLRDGG